MCIDLEAVQRNITEYVLEGIFGNRRKEIVLKITILFINNISIFKTIS